MDSNCRTVVAVPTMLTSPESIDRLIETLEIHYLANRDPQLHFALLTDFCDAPEENQWGDKSLLRLAVAGVEMLNSKYQSDRRDIFFLFHRPRRWNGEEGLWMGYERKRGKLMQFNALLREKTTGSNFSEITGETDILSTVKYVITLDTDTQLPRDAARQLVSIMAHPLNRPVFDDEGGIVAEGYGILQPRVGVSLPSARRSLFVRLFAGDTGIDPYTREVSDVYQDLFQEGSFIGKGIYDVDAFERAVKGRFPENTILSHDLLESCFARSALVSDVEFYEGYPSRYNVDVDRRHRWIRGDWQIAQWLFSRVPSSDTGFIANPLSVLSQWKILDNLRRSLVPVAMMMFILGSWFLLPTSAAFALWLLFAMITLPGLLSSIVNLFNRPTDLPLAMHLRGVVGSLGRQLGQTGLTLTFLPYDAFISLDAIGRTMVRMLMTHKRRLEWRTSSDVEKKKPIDLSFFYVTMWIAPIMAVATVLFLIRMHPASLILTVPIPCLWLVAPFITWLISRPIKSATPGLTTDQLTFLNHTARKTWHFFETFVTQEENWLPPDNFQEVPSPTIASRTSPTNMGLAVLANLAARDLGYLSTGGLIHRTQDAITTMQSLERYQTHFYNWYDTRTLKPLIPLYVSSVDSGNLAGHLLTLASGLREVADEKIYTPQIFAGLRDTVGVLRELAQENTALNKLYSELIQAPSGMLAGFTLLKTTVDQAKIIAVDLESEKAEVRDWALTFKQNCEENLNDMLFLAPWLTLFTSDNSNWVDDDNGLPSVTVPLKKIMTQLDQAPTLREVSLFEQSICAVIETACRDLVSESSTFLQAKRKQLTELSLSLGEAGDRAHQRMLLLETLVVQIEGLAAMDFTFLFDKTRKLFCTGFSIADRRCDNSFYDLLVSEQARQLQQNIEQHAWDGEWYRRAWFDNGDPLDSSVNQECQIDSLPQSWSVISGAGDPSRSNQAMQSVDQRLVRRDAGLIQLFDPPFDKSLLNPGYIKGYIPGVRENGGQYTHGAIWTAMAFAIMGDSERAWELFDMLNPVHHGGTPEQIAVYKVEPYVVAADVYAIAPHTGRGGWTWYTGSAGWMYRLLLETLLGANPEGNQLRLAPHMPKAWKTSKIHYRYRQTVYHITITRLIADSTDDMSLSLDGQELSGKTIPLINDSQEHPVEMKIRQ